MDDLCMKEVGNCNCYYCRDVKNKTLKACLVLLVFLVVLAVAVIEFGLV